MGLGLAGRPPFGDTGMSIMMDNGISRSTIDFVVVQLQSTEIETAVYANHHHHPGPSRMALHFYKLSRRQTVDSSDVSHDATRLRSGFSQHRPLLVSATVVSVSVPLVLWHSVTAMSGSRHENLLFPRISRRADIWQLAWPASPGYHDRKCTGY